MSPGYVHLHWSYAAAAARIIEDVHEGYLPQDAQELAQRLRACLDVESTGRRGVDLSEVDARFLAQHLVRYRQNGGAEVSQFARDVLTRIERVLVAHP